MFSRNGGRLSRGFLTGMLLISTVSLSTCSVKVSREGCPSLLELVWSDTYVTEGRFFLYWREKGAGRLDSLMVETSGNRTSCRLQLPRACYEFLAVSGCQAGNWRDGLLRVPEGEEVPPVWMDFRSIELSGEMQSDTLSLHKNYCQLEVRLPVQEGPETDSPVFSVRGRVCGYALDGSLVPGDYSCLLQPGPDGICRVRLPRQSDSSLELEVCRSGQSVHTFQLGEYLEEAGYDWTQPDLEDCSMVLDIAVTGLSFRVGNWYKRVEFIFEI